TSFTRAALAVLVWCVTLVPGAAEESAQSEIENFDKYIGRPLVEDSRALNADLIRTLPLACPPFHLLDENGEIIDPTKDEFGQPVDPKDVRGIPRAISTRNTCGACHDYDRVTHGYHFMTGRDELFAESPATAGTSPHRSPGFFGKWQLLYQRELSPKYFDDPDHVDMTPFEWIVSCGVCHPGGGPAEYDRAGQRYDRALRLDRELAYMGDGDYHESPWELTGVMEADCFICHLAGYEYSIRAQQIKKLNFKWAATAASGLGYVWGSVADGQTPNVYYKKSLFLADGTVHLPIQRPGDRQCLFCHDISSVQKRGSTWHQHYEYDVHTEQGMTCLKCHPGDLRHNFAKGSSSSQTVRDNLDDSMLSCKECHEQQVLGAPDYKHEWLPYLHLERISCEACHITTRPFIGTGVVDTVAGDWRQLPFETDPSAADTWMFGAMWGSILSDVLDSRFQPFTQEELTQAAEMIVPADAPIRQSAPGLSEEPFRVRDEVARLGGLEAESARAAMLFALDTLLESRASGEHAVGVFRGNAYHLQFGAMREVQSTLQPRRPGATIAASPFAFARAKDGGVIHPEGYQLGVFWAIMDGEFARPLFPREMKAAWNFLHDDEYKHYLYPGHTADGAPSPAVGVAQANPTDVSDVSDSSDPSDSSDAAAPADQAPAEETPPGASEVAETAETAEAPGPSEAELAAAITGKLTAFKPEERRLVKIHDDNNDSFPEANTDEEIAAVAWALKQTAPRLADRDLFYVKGETVYRVEIADWRNPYDGALTEMPPVAEGAPFLRIDRHERVERPGESSWDPPQMVWERREMRIAPAYEVAVQPVDPATHPEIAALAQRLSWTVSHGVEPAKMALGANGCADCHAADAHFFFGSIATDPYTADGTPATRPMYEALGYNKQDLLIGAWRETVLKPLSPYAVLAVLAMIILHFVIFGIKGGSPAGPPNVVRFRIHERLSHLVSMTTVVFLAVTGFCFLLGKSDPLAHWARPWHTYFGYVASVGVLIMVLVWLLSMLPARGDLKWLLKAGGYLGGVKGHLPAGKFNAGQKVLFWMVVAAFGALIVTGVLMGLNRDAHFAGQELLYTIHDVAGLVMIVLLMAHVYLATVVVPHSLRSLFGGKVSDVWAHEHHADWKHPEPGNTGACVREVGDQAAQASQ
ncbi:MAG TPA: formate dehydrogenase subunit gamma, partial [Candidatus Hydrogenedentes bacterium]|nr:formate dehydrogenase subunit gamma [Candidatus Hydrogenedentota bacterium]